MGYRSGTVKWFNDEKGYGFIKDDETKEEYFVHYSFIMMDGHKTLAWGQKVSFLPSMGERGLVAGYVIPTL